MPDDLLGELILNAYAHHVDTRPIVVAVEMDGPDGQQSSSAALLPDALFRLTTRTVASRSWAVEATNELPRVPVLGMPPWGRVTASGPTGGRLRQLHEQLLVEVRPRDQSSVLGFVVPASSVISKSGQGFRQLLRSTWQPMLVLYATGGLREVHASFNLVFVLACPAGIDVPTKFFRLPRPEGRNHSAVREDFGRLLKRAGGRGTHGFVARTLPAPAASLAFDRLDPEIHQQREALSDFGSATRLGELFEVVPSVHSSARQTELVRQATPEASRLLRGRDVLREGTIASPEQDARYIYASSDSTLRVGDLVVRKLHPTTDRGTLVVAVISASDLPAAADYTLIALRERHRLTDAHRRLLLLFLASPATSRLVHATTHDSNMTVSHSGLLDVVVPEPDGALSDAIGDLARSSQQFDAWSSRAQQLLLSVFEFGSPSEARARLIEEGRDIRLKVEAGALIDDFDTRVRTRYPYPLAYRWRTVEALASGEDLRATHEAVLETFEVLLCYTALVAHVMARVAGLTLGATNSIRQKLASGSSGPGLGDWVAVLEEVASSKAIARLPDDQPLGELRQLLTASMTGARRRLTERRLGQAHLRRVTPEEFTGQVAEELQDLRTMLTQAAFLTDLPLLHLTRVELDTITATTSVTYRQLMGDHPIVPYQTMTVPRSDLENGSLYVMDSRSGLHLLRPFLVGRDCPHCNTWSTFHADRTTMGTLAIKSLEHGHAIDAPELVKPLKSVGLM